MLLADYVSAFPAGVNVAATWDRGLAYARGAAMGVEFREKGVDVQLGPAAGPLGRAPESGRNWEGFRFAFDPFLGLHTDDVVRIRFSPGLYLLKPSRAYKVKVSSLALSI